MILYKYTHRHNTLPMCSFTQASKSVVWCFMPSQLLQLRLGDGSHKPCSQSSGGVWKSRWTSWAPVPNKPTVSVDVKQHFNNNKALQTTTRFEVTTALPNRGHNAHNAVNYNSGSVRPSIYFPSHLLQTDIKCISNHKLKSTFRIKPVSDHCLYFYFFIFLAS